ncbi:PP2C family serine/threonine-protein phosphatase [Gemmatimonas sp.]|uniref:PP2C family protein-serine/threonine phosphatase n=1 Tax=Gemmatimonas sp. TaxID=1962908 RepID=UPI0035650E3A
MTAPASHTERLSGDHRVVARVFALTDVGRTREHNEDTFLVADLETGTPLDFTDGYHEITTDPHGLLFLVADGMGGAASGELASSMAGSLVLEALRHTWKSADPSPEAFAEALRDATVLANASIHRHAREHPEHRGMGTTATIAGLLGDRLFMVQVGDSRAYMVRDGDVRQLTKDQSLMQRLVEAGELTAEEAEVSERRNIILQALGPEAHVTVDLTHQQVRRGDTLILCSDGLSGLVRAPEIARTAHDEQDMRSICKRLVDRANQLGGPDNITVIAARFDGDALRASGNGDSFGYNTFPLAGTLNDEAREPLLPMREARSTLKSDPTPRFGTPLPSRALLEEEFGRAQAAEDHAVLGAPEPVFEERRRAVQPVFLVLGLIAFIAITWLLFELLG